MQLALAILSKKQPIFNRGVREERAKGEGERIRKKLYMLGLRVCWLPPHVYPVLVVSV